MKIKSKAITLTISFTLGILVNFFIIRIFLEIAINSAILMLFLAFLIYFSLGFSIQKLFERISEISVFYALPFFIIASFFFFFIAGFGVTSIKAIDSFSLLFFSSIPIIAYLAGIGLARRMSKNVS